MRIAVITANFGSMDAERVIPEQTVRFDRFYFNELNSLFPFSHLDNRRKAKYYKIQALHHLDYNFYVWIDGNVEVKSPRFVEHMVQESLLGSCLQYDIALRVHPERKNVYEEGESIINAIYKGDKYLAARYDPNIIQKEIAFYKRLGMPDFYPLYWCGCFAYVQTKKTMAFFDDWWRRDLQWANFDQMAFSFEAWRNDLSINALQWTPYYDNEFMRIHAHKKIQ